MSTSTNSVRSSYASQLLHLHCSGAKAIDLERQRCDCLTSEMLSIVGEREQTHRSVMLVWSETLCAHAIRMCMLSGVDMLREELQSI